MTEDWKARARQAERWLFDVVSGIATGPEDWNRLAVAARLLEPKAREIAAAVLSVEGVERVYYASEVPDHALALAAINAPPAPPPKFGPRPYNMDVILALCAEYEATAKPRLTEPQRRTLPSVIGLSADAPEVAWTLWTDVPPPIGEGLILGRRADNTVGNATAQEGQLHGGPFIWWISVMGTQGAGGVRVHVIERERGRGSELYADLGFATAEIAEAYVRFFNCRNTADTAPDYYLQAHLVGPEREAPPCPR